LELERVRSILARAEPGSEGELDPPQAAERDVAALRREHAEEIATTDAREQQLLTQLRHVAGQLQAALEGDDGLDLKAEVATNAATHGALTDEKEKLANEIHDLERLLESECWRGLATHRDLAHAHQRIREFEGERRDHAGSTARGEAHAELAEQRDAIEWLLKSSPNAHFVEEAHEILPEIERRLHGTRRHLRKVRQEFKAQRQGLLESALTAERAADNAHSVGMEATELDRKRTRATERLKKFDGVLDSEIDTLEETLHATEDARLWLMRELGSQTRDTSVEDELLLEAQDSLKRLEAKTDQAEQKAHAVERDALLAMQSL
jgi:chromosome segregation ATPase